jgi:SEC-C motif domain protein
MGKSKADTKLCPCGTKKPYAVCCRPLHQGGPAPDAEALMRSRYAAFALGLNDYIQRSWHASKRPSVNAIDDTEKLCWQSLQIKHHEQIDSDHAVVEFVARYKINGRAFVLHETSRFIRENEYWFYVDGITQ